MTHLGRDEIGNYFEDTIDEVAIYNWVLSESEIQDNNTAITTP
ncbi:hypothetical protein ACFLVL_00315 [Chloroflexota bacterium]